MLWVNIFSFPFLCFTRVCFCFILHRKENLIFYLQNILFFYYLMLDNTYNWFSVNHFFCVKRKKECWCTLKNKVTQQLFELNKDFWNLGWIRTKNDGISINRVHERCQENHVFYLVKNSKNLRTFFGTKILNTIFEISNFIPWETINNVKTELNIKKILKF